MACILVVDDNRDMVDTTVALLRGTGHICHPCYKGAEALSLVRGFDPDVVLLDIRMPGMDGYVVAKSIREAAPGVRPMLIAISGEHAEGGEAPLRAAVVGFDHFLVKPFDHDALLALIETAQQRRGES